MAIFVIMFDLHDKRFGQEIIETSCGKRSQIFLVFHKVSAKCILTPSFETCVSILECIIKPSNMTMLLLRDSPGVHSGGKSTVCDIIIFLGCNTGQFNAVERDTAPPSHTLSFGSR